MITKRDLERMYIREHDSMQNIAIELGCSLNKVKYWMDIHGIPSRSISEAVYLKNNPKGDPFKVKKLTNKNDLFIMGLGLGLYWGEGTKSNKNSIRLGNTDPALILSFIKFMDRVYGVKKEKLKFGLQIFNDIISQDALSFWVNILGVDRNRFQKVVVTPSRGFGTYRKKVKYGVITIYYHNKKLRDILCGELKKMGFCD